MLPYFLEKTTLGKQRTVIFNITTIITNTITSLFLITFFYKSCYDSILIFIKVTSVIITELFKVFAAIILIPGAEGVFVIIFTIDDFFGVSLIVIKISVLCRF